MDRRWWDTVQHVHLTLHLNTDKHLHLWYHLLFGGAPFYSGDNIFTPEALQREQKFRSLFTYYGPLALSCGTRSSLWSDAACVVVHLALLCIKAWVCVNNKPDITLRSYLCINNRLIKNLSKNRWQTSLGVNNVILHQHSIREKSSERRHMRELRLRYI